MKQILIWLLTLTIALPALARDFQYTYQGQTLTYTVINESARTCKTKDGNNSAGNTLSGALEIPTNVSDGRNTFRVLEIGQYGFFGCKNLTSVIIPNSVTTFGQYAFNCCEGLTRISISSSVTNFGGESSFLGCPKLEYISVDSQNMVYCSDSGVLFSKDKKTIIRFPQNKGSKNYTIPNTVTTIGKYAFDDCSNLTSITIPNSVTAIGGSAFEGCTGLTSVTIPNSVTTIDGSAFAGCTGLTSVTIPNSVTTIGRSAFAGCTGLTGIIIPNSITSIYSSTFNSCSGLISVTIPESVVSIYDHAFYGCSSLTEIYCNTMTPPSVGNNAFAYVPSTCTLNVQIDAIEDYRNSTYWNNFTNIVGTEVDTFTIDGVNYAKYFYDKSYLVITGADATFTSLELPSTVRKNGKNYDVIEIARYAFEKNSALTEITIPATICSIAQGAFKGCTSLKKVTFLDGNKTLNIIPCFSEDYEAIGKHAFYYCPLQEVYVGRNLEYPTYDLNGWSPFACTSLEYVTIGEGVTTYPMFLLYSCESLKSINIPSTIAKINYTDFSSSTSLTNINVESNNPAYSSINGALYDKQQNTLLLVPTCNATSFEIPSSVTKIENGAFYGCKGLSSVTIPNSVTSIGASAFEHCSNLSSITIPNSVAYIGHSAFLNCSSLTSITIPNSVTYIDNYTFFFCSNLKYVNIPKSVTRMGVGAFLECKGLLEIHCDAITPPQIAVYNQSEDDETYDNTFKNTSVH